jgi:hypothetical protein
MIWSSSLLLVSNRKQRKNKKPFVQCGSTSLGKIIFRIIFKWWRSPWQPVKHLNAILWFFLYYIINRIIYKNRLYRIVYLHLEKKCLCWRDFFQSSRANAATESSKRTVQ